MATKSPRRTPFRSKLKTTPQGPPKPTVPGGSSKRSTHPSPTERVYLAGRNTRAALTVIKRQGGRRGR